MRVKKENKIGSLLIRMTKDSLDSCALESSKFIGNIGIRCKKLGEIEECYSIRQKALGILLAKLGP